MLKFLILLSLILVGCAKSVEMSDSNLIQNPIPITTENSGSMTYNFSSVADGSNTLYTSIQFSESLRLTLPSKLRSVSFGYSVNYVLELYKNNSLIATYVKNPNVNEYIKVYGDLVNVQSGDKLVMLGMPQSSTVSMVVIYSK